MEIFDGIFDRILATFSCKFIPFLDISIFDRIEIKIEIKMEIEVKKAFENLKILVIFNIVDVLTS